MRRGRPSLSPQAPTQAPVISDILQVNHGPVPPALGSPSTNTGQEEVEHNARPARVSAAAVAMQVAAALPVQPSSNTLAPTAVSVSVSVQDNPVSASAAQPASAVHPHGQPTLLPRSSSPPVASSAVPGPPVPSMLRDLAAGQGHLGQPSGTHGRQHGSHTSTEVEYRDQTQASPMDDAPGTVHNAGISSIQTTGDTACPSGHVGEPSAPESAMPGHITQPPPSGAEDPDYNLDSAITQQFHSLPGRGPPGPKPERWSGANAGIQSTQDSSLSLHVRMTQHQQTQPKREAATPNAGVQPTQGVLGMDPSLSHHVSMAEQHPQPRPEAAMADRLISDRFDRLGRSNSGGVATASGTDRHTDTQLQPEELTLPPHKGPASG